MRFTSILIGFALLLLAVPNLACKVQILHPDSGPPSTPNLVTVVATAISGAANDTIEITFDDQMTTGGGANDCDNLANWTIESPDGSPLTLTATSISATGNPTTVTITLSDARPDDDNLQFGASVRVTLTNTSVGTVGGDTFAASSGTTTLTTTVAGDNAAPTITSITQNRTVDATGRTVDVLWNEAMDDASAETTGNYTFSGGQNVTSATLQADNVTVRVVLDAVAYPPSHTVDISNVNDLAGNAGSGSAVTIGTDDSTAPGVTSATQNRTVDTTGQTVDILFDDRVNQTTAETTSNYTFSGGQNVTSATLQADGVTVRVVLDALAYPPTHTVTVANVTDVAGNTGGGSGISIGTDDSTAPGITSVTQNRTVDPTGQTVDVLFDDRMFPTTAETTGNYTFSGGQNVTSATLQADAVTVRLVLDAVAYPPSHTLDVANVTDIAGNTGSGSTLTITSTDSTAPGVTSATQNRTVDSTGQTVDILFDDRVEQTSAETTGNYTFSGGQNVTSATLQADGVTVRLVLDALAFPPTHTVDIANVNDVAGNTGGASAVSIGSTDSTAPGVSSVSVSATDDEISITFNDDMFPADVTSTSQYTFESPTGTPVTLDSPGTWDSGTRTVTFTTATDLISGETFTVTFTGTNRDIAGNALSASPVSGTVAAATITVPGDYATIQEALDAATAGADIVVAAGTWTGTGNVDLDFGGKDVRLISQSGAASTIIDAENALGVRGFIFDDGETSAALVEGFTIIRGFATNQAADPFKRVGGGILFSNNSSPTVRNCIIRDNNAQGPGPTSGGGIAIVDSSPTFEDCEFHTNSASGNGANIGRGGAIYINSTSPAAATPSFTNCRIYNNTADSGTGQSYGAGVFITGDAASATFINCSIYGNTVTSGGNDDYALGGGIAMVDSSTATITHCSISGNTCSAADGGVQVFGGGLYSGGGATATITNTIIHSNVAADNGQQIAADDGNLFTTVSGTITLSFCNRGTSAGDIYDPATTLAVSDSISDDPQYVNLGGGDLNLTVGSTSIDAGTDAGVTEDQDGTARPAGGGFDMGEYEQ